MKNSILAKLLAAALLLGLAAPAGAWVAAYGGYHGGVAVAYRPPCCYGGAAVAGAVVAGAMVGAAVASSAQPVYAPVYAAPVPVTYAPAVGSVVYAVPGGCASVLINGTSYLSCGGVLYRPFYSGGALVYQVAAP
jgi:hypothetical protein